MLIIELEDFPDDIYILLEDNFRINFFQTAIKIIGSYKKLANILKVSISTVLSWKRAKDGEGNTHFCSVKNVKTISKILVNNNYKYFCLSEVQKYIKAYKDAHGKLWICKPNLPIKDSIEMREIITHLICDGSAPLTPRRTSKYASTCKKSAEEFLNELGVFGKILRNGKNKIYIQTESKLTKGFRNKYVVPFPKALTKILTKNLNISFDTFNSRLPKFFFYGNKKLLVSVVRAFLIDEGHIKDTRSYFTSSNRRLLEDLNKICRTLNYKRGKIAKYREIFKLSISAHSIKRFYYDILSIKKLPIEEKQKRLELAIKLSCRKRKKFVNLDKTIVYCLTEKPMTLVELSSKLGIRSRAIWFYTKKLEAEGKIKVIDKMVGKGGANIWSIV